MGDNPFRPPFADPQPEYRPHLHATFEHATNGATATTEDEGVIKCICGFSEDDGETVLCELCNTWQHIACFYASPNSVPEVHKCTECWPRPLDQAAAIHKQKIKQTLILDANNDDRKPKRPGPKPHRKSKTKDVAQPGPLTNGWPSNDYPHDRTSGSPREQGPPTKKPKTSHKHQGSGTTATSAAPHGFASHSRTLSSTGQVDALPLAECPPEYFSHEFIRVHRENTDFTPAHANLHLDMTVTNSLSNWLDDPDEFAKATGGQTHDDVFQHLPQPIEELECPVKKHVHRDTTVQFHGGYPAWPYLTVERDLYAGDLVGELRGSIGHREDYKADPANRWDKLHHPDHFVFFHPALPIYIDCRSEGNNLRYVRRSCRPNIRLDTIITGAREYRFCFTALTAIARDSEITIGWDTGHDPQLQECLSHSIEGAVMLDQEKQYVTHWVETILAHFGGCACDKQLDTMCWMAYFDRRLNNLSTDVSGRPAKSAKRRRNTKTSPNVTHAHNSRESSEAAMHRSNTHSPRSHRSRDVTPAQPYNNDDNIGSEIGDALSARDRKKLMQQEHLFSKLDGANNGTRRKKRVSNSAVTTPATTASVCSCSVFAECGSPLTHIQKPLHRSESSTSNNTPAPQARSPPADDSMKHARVPPLSNNHSTPVQANQLSVRQVTSKPTYADSSAQTITTDVALPVRQAAVRRPCISLSRRLLKKAVDRQLRNASSQDLAQALSEVTVISSTLPSAAIGVVQASTEPSVASAHDSGTLASEDVEMEDAEPAQSSVEDSTTRMTGGEEMPVVAAMVQPAFQPPHPLMEPPDPPWQDANSAHNDGTSDTTLAGRRSAGLHVDLPPPPVFSETSSIDRAKALSTESPVTMNSGIVFATPVHGINGSVAAPTPSPAKKKMSLSDYMNKRKSETPATEKTLGQAQQAFGPSGVSFGQITPGNLGSSENQENAVAKTNLDELIKSELLMPPVSESG